MSFWLKARKKDVDARDKRGHDAGGDATSSERALGPTNPRLAPSQLALKLSRGRYGLSRTGDIAPQSASQCPCCRSGREVAPFRRSTRCVRSLDLCGRCLSLSRANM